MKIYRFLSITLLSLALAGCHKRPPCAIIPVPPKDSRTPVFDLPLTNETSGELIKWLKAGLNENNMKDDVAVIEGVETRYGKRLKLVTNPEHPNLHDLETAKFKEWFSDPVIKQVVDSRDGSPKDHPNAVAANDHIYWWIFYPRDDGQLTGVMVIKLNACQTLKEAKR